MVQKNKPEPSETQKRPEIEDKSKKINKIFGGKLSNFLKKKEVVSAMARPDRSKQQKIMSQTTDFEKVSKSK